MGCVCSKGFRRNAQRVSWYSPMSRNVSTASSNQRFECDREFDHVDTLTSSSYAELNTETYHGSFLNLGRRAKHYKTLAPGTEFENSFTFMSHSDVKHKGACAGTKLGMHKEERKRLLMCDNSERCPPSKRHGIEIINTSELMEGLEDIASAPSSLRSQNFGKLSIPDKQISFSKLQGSINEPDIGSPVWKKYYMQEDEIVCMEFSFAQNSYTPPIGSPFRESPRRAHTPPPGSPFSESPRWAHTPLSGSPFSQSPRKAPSRGSLIDIEDCRSISSIELLDASTIGLKFLVSPANSSFHPSPVTEKEGSHSARLSFDGNTRSSHRENASFDGHSGHLHSYFDDAKSPYRSPNTTRHSSKKPSTESVYGSGSPLFDPSLMATFEEALKATTEAASYDEWLQFSTDGSTVPSSTSADTQASFDTTFDAESTPLWDNREKLLSKIMPIDEDDVTSKQDLSSYDLKCPPRGEGKVVLYVTSLRGIRKTYQDCCNLRLILRGLGVQVDERDVWMHSKFKSELMDVLSGLSKGVPQVPQLFIKGRYVGGAEEVKQLHEEGVLTYLMDGLAMGLIHNVCDGCGDARFVPCCNCNGSCKVLNEDNEVLRCLDCNENGLIMCPMCIM